MTFAASSYVYLLGLLPALLALYAYGFWRRMPTASGAGEGRSRRSSSGRSPRGCCRGSMTPAGG
jgi:hypothetical protein